MSETLQSAVVLLIEDTATDAELCIRALEKQHIAHDIIWLRDGAEALAYLFEDSSDAARRATPRIILLDLNLPKVHGLEVLRRIKQDERTRTVPVVVLTSSTVDSDIVTSYDLGVNSFISKPVEFPAFVNTITQLGMYWLITNRPPRAKN